MPIIWRNLDPVKDSLTYAYAILSDSACDYPACCPIAYGNPQFVIMSIPVRIGRQLAGCYVLFRIAFSDVVRQLICIGARQLIFTGEHRMRRTSKAMHQLEI